MIGRDSRGSALVPRQNRLLAALDADAYAELLPRLEFVPLPQRWVICEASGVLEHVYFPVSGIVSFLYESASGTSVEIALAGNDGLAGIHLLMGGSRDDHSGGRAERGPRVPTSRRGAEGEVR